MFELVCLGTDAARKEVQVDVFSNASCVFQHVSESKSPNILT